MKILVCALCLLLPLYGAAQAEPTKEVISITALVKLTGVVTKEVVKLPRGNDHYDQFMGYLLTVPTNVGTLTSGREDERVLEKLVGKKASIEGLGGVRSFQ